jgi:hypothetical protein
MDALERANEVRLERARMKQAVAAGRIGVAAAMGHECCRTLLARDLLMWQHRWGRIRALKVLSALQIAEYRTVEDLTERQKTLLVKACER